MIKIKNLCKSYQMGNNNIEVLKNLNLTIKAGEFVSIIGKSGSGKSTLMNIIGLLDAQTSGEFYFCNNKIQITNDKEVSKIRNISIGFVFQSFNLITKLNAFQNVELPLIYKGLSQKERSKITKDALEMVGLSDRMTHKPNEMSGGQQQRVAIARAIATNPKLIPADEPTGNLDENSSKEIINILQNIHESGKTVVIITHDNEIAKSTNRIIQLSDGKIYKDIYLKSNESKQ